MPSEDVALTILQRKLKKDSTSEKERTRLQAHTDWLLEVRYRVDSLMSSIVDLASSGDNELTEFLLKNHYTLRDRDCYEPAVEAFHAQCMRLPQVNFTSTIIDLRNS